MEFQSGSLFHSIEIFHEPQLLITDEVDIMVLKSTWKVRLISQECVLFCPLQATGTSLDSDECLPCLHSCHRPQASAIQTLPMFLKIGARVGIFAS